MSGFVPYTAPRPYRALTTDVAALEIRQHPQHAVITPENKEKMRRPVDPPPIVQLNVTHQQDPTREFLVNPFLFMTATLVEEEAKEDGTYKPISGVQIIGQNVSSLHRLKDINNKDGGFFVFGDISCRKIGGYRMQFNLFDFDKNTSHVAFVSSIISRRFRVVSQKEFKGLSESTHLSRTFSDQGVRLRLRKEPRSITGAKRGYPDPTQEVAPHIHPGMFGGGPVHDNRMSGQDYEYGNAQQKRARSGSDYTNYGSASSQHSGAGMSQYGYPNTGSAWPSQPQIPLQANQPSYGSLAPHLQPQMGPNSNYQRYIQPDAYSSDSAAAGSNFQYNSSRSYGPTPARYQRPQDPVPPYQMQQARPSYDSGTSRDAFQSLPTLKPTAPLQNSGLIMNQGQSQHGSMSQSGGQSASMGSGLLSTSHAQHDPQQYGSQALPIHSPNQSYHADGHLESLFGQSTQPEMKYGANSYQTSDNMYSNGAATGGLSDTGLSLGNGMLNRSFAPPQAALQQSVYNGDDTTGMGSFKQEPPPYPTPNQTSPLG